MAAPITQVYTNQAAIATSATIYPQRVREENGVAKVSFTGTSFTCAVQGRSDSTAPWFTIAAFNQTQLDANGSFAIVVSLFPEMRFDLTAIVAGSLNLFLME
jgi:hypothetical protein